MGGGSFPPALYEALRHASVNQRVFVVLKPPLVLRHTHPGDFSSLIGLDPTKDSLATTASHDDNSPTGFEAKYRKEADALEVAMEDASGGEDGDPVLLYEMFITEFVPWEWMPRFARLDKARQLISW